MSEMVERVAKEIHWADSADDGLDYEEWCRALARAAIEAMLTPTKAMLDAVGHFNGEYHDDYQAMVRAALKEPEA